MFLVVIRRLDWEKIFWYNLIILVVNIDENKISIRVFLINVIDKNDNVFVFLYINYLVIILSNFFFGFEVFRINVIDVDIGENVCMCFYLFNY